MKLRRIHVCICVKNPSMLHSRSKLLEEARVKVEESFQFKKGRSRSKRLNPTAPTPKRSKIDQSTRLA